ncbi:hypothetical protein MesoLjLc_50480 [Mesorhizobium sp. L-8-10]|uniref:DUF2163 domain-containing protein n=1 Tax=Mesorhizobium sp. L-8-10 TaxID=2744523 RepID=UPI001925F79B|nr:DUF2163 domain-containing protein [Mesorhizobium sp. L-8-10]BCH33118.1 hypothetical protein MesoLjLc_50480 [Mesorhizobium sp. L-8-10]
MSRNWSATLISMLSGEEITRCFLAELNNGITPVVRMTSFDADLPIGAETFSKSAGFNVSRYVVRTGGEAAALDIELPFSDDGPIYADHVRRGAWRGATAIIWIADFSTSPPGREIIAQGFVGLTEFTDRLQGRIEIATLADAMKDIILPTIQTKCHFQFAGPRCGVNAATYTRTGEVTAVTNRRNFTATVTSPGSLNFTKGKVTFTSGANAGAKAWVRSWSSGTGVFEMVTDFPFDIQVGDDFSVLSGCEQDRAACVLYDNVNRFPGTEFVLE